jgi:hypothetical protein
MLPTGIRSDELVRPFMPSLSTSRQCIDPNPAGVKSSFRVSYERRAR